MKIKTIQGEGIHLTTIKKASILSDMPHYPHIGWLIFWILVFFPATLLWLGLGLMRKKYAVQLTLSKGSTRVVELDHRNMVLATTRDNSGEYL